MDAGKRTNVICFLMNWKGWDGEKQVASSLTVVCSLFKCVVEPMKTYQELVEK